MKKVLTRGVHTHGDHTRGGRRGVHRDGHSDVVLFMLEQQM